jgi:hypothetical protein
MKVLIVEPEKHPYAKDIDSGLQSMQEVVGGLIQAVYPFDDPAAIVCNEEGKLLGMEYNRALYDESGAIYDIICGPFFICSLGEEDFTSLSEPLTDKYCKLFAHPELFVRVGETLMVMRA